MFLIKPLIRVLASGALLATLAACGGQQKSAGGTMTMELSAADGEAAAHAEIRSDDGNLLVKLTLENLPPAPDGTYYECWLVADDDTLAKPNRVAVGTFRHASTSQHDLGREPAAFPQDGRHPGA